MTDVSSFELFYLRHVAAVIALLERRTGDAHLVADVTAEAFAHALAQPEPTRESLLETAAAELDAAERRGHVDRRMARRLGMDRVAPGDEFVTRLRHELRAAARREASRTPLQLRAARPRSRPGRRRAAPLAAGVAAVVAAAAVTVVIGGGAEPRDTPPARGLRVVATVQLAHTLGSIGAGFGSAWLADVADGRVLRVGPRFRQIVARIPTGRTSVTVGAGAVWALDDEGRLLRIDPRTNRVSARVDLHLPGLDPRRLYDVQVFGGRPWVVGPDRALRLDAATGRVVHRTRIPVREQPFSVVGAADGLWVLTREPRLLRLDLLTGRRIGAMPIRLPGVEGALPTKSGPVLVTRGDVARADPDGRVAWVREVGEDLTGLPLLDGDTLWVHVSNAPTGRDRVVALDLASGRLRAAVTVPEFGASGLAPVGRDIWVTVPTGKVMVLRR
jgi:hypothetical protein